MTYRDEIVDRYFEWMYDMVCHDRFADSISYRKLFMFLHNTPFRHTVPKDKNRAKGGVDLRYLFARSTGDRDADLYLYGPCSVLEMMIALAIRCEEVMDDPQKGDRTGQWFWGMINNLGLGSMMDSRFDRHYVEGVVERFLDRKYDPDGKGGLFRVRGSGLDMRYVEIWIQMCHYLDTIA